MCSHFMQSRTGHFTEAITRASLSAVIAKLLILDSFILILVYLSEWQESIRAQKKIYWGRKENVRCSDKNKKKMEKGGEREKSNLIPYGHGISPSFSFCEIGRYNTCLQQLCLLSLDSLTAGTVTPCSE